ncbi:hypothetical protein [Nocardia asteroides]
MNFLHQGTRSCHPDHYIEAATRTEAELRADFAMRHFLLEVAPFADVPATQIDFLSRAHDIERRWTNSVDEVSRRQWSDLDTLRQQWMSDSHATRGQFWHMERSRAAGVEPVEEVTARHWRQMAELTGAIEPVNTFSEQDAAEFRAQGRHLILIRGTDADSAVGTGAAERALGGRAAEQLDMDRIGALIDSSRELVTESDEPSPSPDRVPPIVPDSLIPDSRRNAAVVADLSATQAQVMRQVGPVRVLQDLFAEHLRLSETFDHTLEGGQELIDRLEGLLDAARAARQAAALAGVTAADIDAAYRAGLEGQYWSQRPGVPHLALVDQLITQRDAAYAELGQYRTGLGHDHGAALALAAGAERTTYPQEPAIFGGGVIASAVEAALPVQDAIDHTAWTSPETTGVIEPIRPQPVIDPHI